MQLSLELDRRPPTAEGLRERLLALGLPSVPRVITHRNRAVMVSWFPGRELRIHEGYAHAPDSVLSAIIRFLSRRVRRETRLAARQEFLAFPVEDHAPSARRARGREATAPEDQTLVVYFTEMHARLNQEHFAGTLSPIPIRISRRMKRRLGEVRLDRRTGAAVEISLSRRHVRRDGWREAEQTLLHEMIHQWQAENGQPVDHGKEFRRWARELGIHPRAVRV
ncbi:MAG TPA: SprT-like domain-containing protein [Gemmatimonadales bacterium]|nr:SprT-like domain-containing protein [Gemmatimonadales bacterium]